MRRERGEDAAPGGWLVASDEAPAAPPPWRFRAVEQRKQTTLSRSDVCSAAVLSRSENQMPQSFAFLRRNCAFSWSRVK